MNPPKATPTQAVGASTSGRKPWVKKSPVDIVIEQVTKQEEKVSAMRTELQREERELAKLQQARKVLETS